MGIHWGLCLCYNFVKKLYIILHKCQFSWYIPEQKYFWTSKVGVRFFYSIGTYCSLLHKWGRRHIYGIHTSGAQRRFPNDTTLPYAIDQSQVIWHLVDEQSILQRVYGNALAVSSDIAPPIFNDTKEKASRTWCSLVMFYFFFVCANVSNAT